jgi:hypothetical protein
VKEEISVNYAEGSSDHSFWTGILVTVCLKTEVMKEHVNNTTHNSSCGTCSDSGVILVSTS